MTTITLNHTTEKISTDHEIQVTTLTVPLETTDDSVLQSLKLSYLENTNGSNGSWIEFDIVGPRGGRIYRLPIWSIAGLNRFIDTLQRMKSGLERDIAKQK